jgi:hypothetical protein
MRVATTIMKLGSENVGLVSCKWIRVFTNACTVRSVKSQLQGTIYFAAVAVLWN